MNDTKKKYITNIIQCASLYKENLCSRDFLIVYAVSGNIKVLTVRFLSKNFPHLAGIKANPPLGAEELYKRCINNKLSIRDFEFTSINHTPRKLSIFPHIATNNLSARKICDYNDDDFIRLITDKFIGDESACIGIKNSEDLYHPNTLLKQSIRDVYCKRVPILYILRKRTKESDYNEVTYTASGMPTLELPTSKEKIVLLPIVAK